MIKRLISFLEFMADLTPENAENFARKIFENDKVRKEGEWHIFHSKAVEETALFLAKRRDVDKSILKEASWLIDVGRTIGGDIGHPLRSLELAKGEFELPDKLKDCIINHEISGNHMCDEAKIIQIADKVSVLRPEFLELFQKYSKVNPMEKEWNIKFVDSVLSSIPDLLRKM